jgi:undecaprenyl diphosphate synthase
VAGVEPLTFADQEAERLRAQIVAEKLPAHIAVIMDGNGRWARERGFMDRIRGHEAGSDSVRVIVRACGELGIKVLTLYAFSIENWQRPRQEISALMSLLKRFLMSEQEEIRQNKVRLVVSGELENLPGDVKKILDETVKSSAGNGGLVLNLALSYGGRTEILHAVKRLGEKVRQGVVSPENITEADIASNLYHPELPDPDLLIRTSGEMRVSNFLLWQIAYTEIHVTPVLWPDFRRPDLYRAILDYQRRDRRYGKVQNS